MVIYSKNYRMTYVVSSANSKYNRDFPFLTVGACRILSLTPVEYEFNSKLSLKGKKNVESHHRLYGKIQPVSFIKPSESIAIK